MKKFIEATVISFLKFAYLIFSFIGFSICGVCCSAIAIKVVDIFCGSNLYTTDNVAMFALILTVVFYIYPISDDDDE